MSRKLKFKIISCSSQQGQYPVSSLLFGGSEGWQTRRFCTYPQQITLQFYGVVNIRKIQITSDHRKISSQVDILYYVPATRQDERFYKYGFLQFNRNEGAKEQKKIMVDINCLYLRLLFHKPHPSKQNFFSQIGIVSLALYGSEMPSSMIPQPAQYDQQAQQGQANSQDDQYIGSIIAKLTYQKQEAIQQQDYETANYYKNTIVLIHQMAASLKQNRLKIKKAIQNDDFDSAAILKKLIEKNKQQIREIVEEKHNGNEQSQQFQQNQFVAENQKQQDQQGNQFMEQPQTHTQNLAASRLSSKMAKSRPIHAHQITQHDDYDERVLPALKSGKTNTEPPQELDNQKPKPPPPVQEVQGKYIKEAMAMQQYFNEDIVKKFFSSHWQHNLDSLNTILAETRKKQKQAGLVKCLVSVVKFSGKQTNFQVSIQSLLIFQQMLKINAQGQLMTKPGDLQNDLQDISREVLKKLTDNNPKIKTSAQAAFAQMISSSLYGVEACSLNLTKSKTKLASKQVATRLSFISKMINQYGLSGGSNSVPLSALDFAIQQLKNPAQQVRRLAVTLLSAAYKKDKQKTSTKLGGLKESIIDQIQEGGAANTPQKHKKK